MAAVNAAPYGGGILSKGPAVINWYAYKPASPDLLTRAARLSELCGQYHLPLAAAALQFPLRDPRLTTTVVDVSRPERLADTVQLARYPIPEEFWAEVVAIQPDNQDLE